MRPYDPIEKGAVTLFTWPDCHDVSGRLFAHENPNYSADYNKDSMWVNNIPKDDVDSVYVPFGYQIELFDQDGFWGDSEIIKGRPYSNDNAEMVCQNLGNMKNRAASARVTRSTELGPAVGYWEGITHTENIDVTYHVGFDYSKSVEDQFTQEFTLSYEMSYGMKFGGVSNEEKISMGYSMGLMHDVQTTYSVDIS